MSKYDEFDAALMSAIQNGADTMSALDSNKKLVALAKPHCRPDPWGNLTPVFRIIDRRLQALRKQGSIVFHNRRWSVDVERAQ
jgi:hypothetical protein